MKQNCSAMTPSIHSGGPSLRKVWGFGLMVLLATGLIACGATPKEFKPAPLTDPAKMIGATKIWTAQIGASEDLLAPFVVDGRLIVASSSGTVVSLDPLTGLEAWRLNVGGELSSGVGFDGQTIAAITLDNELVALREGKVLWRTRLPARTFTAPLVAGSRIFVLMSDRSVSAYDGGSGARLWTQTRSGEPLVLGQGGVLLAVGDTLVAGFSSRLTGLDPNNGSIRWQALLASSRGTNEVERLVDLVGPVSRQGYSVCARSFGTAVGCFDAAKGTTVWNKPSQGSRGLTGDEERVFSTESDGQVVAWQRATGAALWRVDRLKFRKLSTPLVLGRAVVIGDADGFLHVLSREDGSDMARLYTDGSSIVGAPVVTGQMLIAQTQKGGVFAWRLQ